MARRNPGHTHLTGDVSAKAQRAYEDILASGKRYGRRAKSVAAATVRKMISEGKISNPDKFRIVKVRNLKPGDFITNKYTGNHYGIITSISHSKSEPGKFDIYLKDAGPLYGEPGDYEYQITRHTNPFERHNNPGPNPVRRPTKKSKGHLMYILDSDASGGGYEFYKAGEDVYRAPFDNVLDVTTGYRIGRFFAPMWQWKQFKERNMYPFERHNNPGEVESIASGFHGRKVGERFEIEEEELYSDSFAVLGCLVELNITRDGGKSAIPIRGFKTPLDPKYKKGDEVYVAAPDRNNIEFVGGDQKIVNADKLAHVSNKNLICLGQVESIVYLADKHHLVDSNGTEEEYEHDFGRKRYFIFGKRIGRPDLIYDCLNEQMKLVGGSYTITDEGIKD